MSYPRADNVDIDASEQLAPLRERFCNPLVKVGDYSHYPEQASDAIWQAIQNGGRDARAYERASKRTKEAIHAIEEFVHRSGTFVVAPKWEDVVDGTPFSVHIRPDDFVIPVCHEGMNRSQVMHLAAKLVKSCDMYPSDAPAGEYGVSLPHGVFGGFDPHQGYADLTAENWFAYTHTIIPELEKAAEFGDWQQEVFYGVFGVAKAHRVGQEFCEMRGRKMNPDEDDPDFVKLAADRSAQRRNMDSLLFRPSSTKLMCGSTGRTVVLAFGDAASLFIQRMLEAAGPEDFSDIVVVCLPFPDTIGHAGGADELAAHIKKTGERITCNEMRARRHIDVLGTYVRMLQLVVRRV